MHTKKTYKKLNDEIIYVITLPIVNIYKRNDCSILKGEYINNI
jgi:hypothetical protein